MCRSVTEGSDCPRVSPVTTISRTAFIHAHATDASSEKAGCNWGKLRFWVESRTGAVAVVSRWLVGVAFAVPPQSGLAWLCFLFPLIEPDVRSYRIRLSEKTHDFARGKLPVRLGKQTNPNTSYRDSAGKLWAPGHGTLCFVHSHWRSLFLACRSTAS
jgi:hypothetical protein